MSTGLTRMRGVAWVALVAAVGLVAGGGLAADRLAGRGGVKPTIGSPVATSPMAIDPPATLAAAETPSVTSRLPPRLVLRYAVREDANPFPVTLPYRISDDVLRIYEDGEVILRDTDGAALGARPGAGDRFRSIPLSPAAMERVLERVVEDARFFETPWPRDLPPLGMEDGMRTICGLAATRVRDFLDGVTVGPLRYEERWATALYRPLFPHDEGALECGL